MKNIKCIMFLAAGLLLTTSVGFASDGTKITKECSYEVGDLAYNEVAYEVTPLIVVNHNYAFVDSETILVGSVEGSVDVGSCSVNEFGTLTEIFVLENTYTAYAYTNDWLTHKDLLRFKLNYQFCKAPECLVPFRC